MDIMYSYNTISKYWLLKKSQLDAIDHEDVDLSTGNVTGTTMYNDAVDIITYHYYHWITKNIIAPSRHYMLCIYIAKCEAESASAMKFGDEYKHICFAIHCLFKHKISRAEYVVLLGIALNHFDRKSDSPSIKSLTDEVNGLINMEWYSTGMFRNGLGVLDNYIGTWFDCHRKTEGYGYNFVKKHKELNKVLEGIGLVMFGKDVFDLMDYAN